MLIENPIIFIFFIIVIGLLIGQIKIFDISFGASGVLLAAMICGAICAGRVDDSFNLISQMETLSSFGTTLFVSIIGITAGYSVMANRKKNIVAMLIGSFMVLSTAIILKIITTTAKINESSIDGAFCGALTTTPGLATLCELETTDVPSAVTGYGSVYGLGVLITVAFVQVITRKGNTGLVISKNANGFTSNVNPLSILIQISVSAITGVLLGKVRIPIIGYSLGTSGGILCTGIIVGYIVKKHFSDSRISEIIMAPLRTLGLSLFFVGNGFSAGLQLRNGIDLRVLFAGLIMIVVPITVGCLLCNVLSYNRNSTAGVIAGGMTSTPAIGALIQNQKDVFFDLYSAAYLGSLLTTVICIRCV